MVPIVANGLRALGIIVLAHLEGSAAAVETDHIVYGWVFFTLVMMILIAIGMAFTEKPRWRPPVKSTTTGNTSLWRFAVAVSAAGLLALTVPAYAYRLDSLFPAVQLPQADSLHPFIAGNLAPGATAKTDGWSAYPGAPSIKHDPHVVW